MTTSGNNRSAPENATSVAIAGNDSTQTDPVSPKEHQHVAQNAVAPEHDLSDERPVEHGGQAGLEPTRYGDWEKKGRCTDF
ncbi:DUF1674 domain-containing protein [Granulosicoccus antarcticus]|uniref:DUF1674 domain-containing protein n=1 Tax=Granulosicoccus antarcticus IMCC3135 TaxID=1192854 RepID=A0A2Z2NMF6_9GAMM|nr:DUF1674 domain-containing protein [Granulosicoccus antarcticus]ASJ72379.1 hypothetical protein IMCC3135_11445 [Granulosicoccus antarcticus IMCC3135]